MDDKIKKLEEAAPTNSMSGVYQVSPSAGDAFRLGQPDAPKRFYTKADGTWPTGIPGDPNKVFYDRPAGYWGSGRNTTPEVGEPTKRDFTYADVTANGNTNTDQFIRPSDGKVYTALPEGSENVILGPLVTSYAINHGYDDYTNLGYIQKDTRQFVLLARIQGFFKGEDRPRTSYLSHGNIARTWDGTASQLTIYNSNFTLEYALWMKDRYEKGNFSPNFPFRFSGGIPVERHPNDNSMGSGDIMGTDDGQQSADGDTSGTEQDAPDDNDVESLDLWGIEYNQQNPKPKPEDYRTVQQYRRALMRWNRDKRKAEQDYINQQSQQNQSQSQDKPWEKFKDTASKIANFLWQGAKIVTGAKAGEMLADLTINPLVDAAFGQSVADSAGDYNTKLATSLTTSVITGKPQKIILSKEAKKDLINSIDLDMLMKHMTVGPTPDPSADNAVNPGKGKQNGLLKGKWGNQGGTHINYDVDTGAFTITSVKMLRDFGDLDQKNAGGKITNFEDIPNPSLDDVKNIFKQKGLEGPLKKFYNTVANLKISSSTDDKTFRPFAAGYDPNKAAEMMYNGLPDMTKALYNFAVEGTASNAVHLRNQLLKAGVGQSEIEKMGKGFGGYVYNQETYYGTDIPGKHGTMSVGGIVNKKAIEALGIGVDVTLESRKVDENSKMRILREIKQPILIEATPNTTKLRGYRPNFKGKYSPQNTPDVTASKKSDEAVEGYNTSRLAWTSKDKFWKGYETTERMNVIYDRLGHGSQYFDRIVAENTLSNKKMQEHFNILSHEKAMREDDPNYKSPFREIDESETFENKAKDPLFTKVAKKLKKEIDYPKKPAAKGYPNEAPPKVDPNTGYHPKFGKRYKYDKLDPISAKAMAGAPTGDPEIDANVKRQAQKEDWRYELKNLWLGAERGDWKKTVEEGMTTQALTGIVRPAGNTNLASLPMGLTGDGSIDYGNLLSNTEEDPNTLTGDGEYTALTNMSGMFDAPDPKGVGQEVRHWSIADQEFTGTTNIGGGGPYLMNTIPGFQKDASRNVSIRGTHTVKSVPEGGGYYPPSDGNVYLRFDGVGSPRFAALKPVDTTEIDTFEITASRRNNAVNSKAISGFVYDHRPMLYYWCGDHPDYKPTSLKRDSNGRTGLDATVYVSSNIAGTGNDGAVLRSNENDSARYRGPQQYRQGDGWRPIHMKPDGTLDNSVSPYIIDYERNVPSFFPDDAQVVRSPEPYSVPIPDWARGKSARYMIYQAASGSTYYNSFNLHSVQFQRRGFVQTPAITKSLSAVETSPFVRVGPTKKNEGGKERKKKVQDIIDSGLEYTGTKFSKDFPVRTRLK